MTLSAKGENFMKNYTVKYPVDTKGTELYLVYTREEQPEPVRLVTLSDGREIINFERANSGFKNVVVHDMEGGLIIVDFPGYTEGKDYIPNKLCLYQLYTNSKLEATGISTAEKLCFIEYAYLREEALEILNDVIKTQNELWR